MEPIIIRTVRDLYEGGYAVHGWCDQCSAHYPVSLARLILKGKGDKAIRDVQVRHQCGEKLKLRISPLDTRTDRIPGV
jgi:hypothetical protein